MPTVKIGIVNFDSAVNEREECRKFHAVRYWVSRHPLSERASWHRLPPRQTVQTYIVHRISPCGLAIYKQINSQASAILSDINDDNFDHALDFLRSSTADTDQTVTGAVVQRTTDFLAPAIILRRPELIGEVKAENRPSSDVSPARAKARLAWFLRRKKAFTWAVWWSRKILSTSRARAWRAERRGIGETRGAEVGHENSKTK
ncbi:hypothetical protein B0H14DRAFT_3171266 [Mycena olivaceomarginata]|nr:hypothetical protein B0H14DRAFT_3171266 [Mycena olivaceomarginata]